MTNILDILLIKGVNMSKFNGADDIYFTKKNIAVRNISTWIDKRGKYHCNYKTKYYPKTKSNVKQVIKTFGFVRNGR